MRMAWLSALIKSIRQTNTVLPELPPLTMKDFHRSLQKELNPGWDVRPELVELAVRTLSEQALSSGLPLSGDVRGTISGLIAKLDLKLTEQINLILHTQTFQTLEGAWRGLHYLVSQTASDEMLKIRVMNVSKDDLGRTLKIYSGTAWDKGPIFGKLYGESFDSFGGEPFGALVADYYFNHSAPDVELLTSMARILEAIHAPLISAVHPSVLKLSSWQELAYISDPAEIFDLPEYVGWRALRASDNARYIGLTMPRFLARQPYGAKTVPVASFAFEEDVSGPASTGFTWANAAYAMAVNINRSFEESGWCSRIHGIESGGVVEGLPVHAIPADAGGMAIRRPTEIDIADLRAAELAAAGFIPLLHKRNADITAFIGAQSLHKSTERDDPGASANALLFARLPYLFAICRFAHYIKCITRDRISLYKQHDELERYLSNWINKYAAPDPGSLYEQLRASKPLAAAEVQLEDDGNPDSYRAKLWMQPHFRLEGVTAKHCLVSRVHIVNPRDPLDHFNWRLHNTFALHSAKEQHNMKAALRTFADQAIANPTCVSGDAHSTVTALIAALDRQLARQIKVIQHCHEFQTLASAWRGLHYLVNHSEAGPLSKIRVLNISRHELGRTMKRYAGTAWNHARIFQRIYEEPFDQPGGEPFTCIVGDYYFDHSAPDVELLTAMGKVAAAAHAPFLAAVKPSLMQIGLWEELAHAGDLSAIAEAPMHAAWRSLRASEDARYIGLALPRFLAKATSGKDTAVPGSEGITWINAAYAMAVNIQRAFHQYGWYSHIQGTGPGGAAIPNLTETAISEQRAEELAACGIMALVHKADGANASFASTQSLYQPFRCNDPGLAYCHLMAASLPHLLGRCRFAQAMKCIVRDKYPSFKDMQDMERCLTTWIHRYIDGDPDHSSDETRARKPLAGAGVSLEEGDGHYVANYFLRPHYLLEVFPFGCRLISTLPKAAGTM